MRLGRGQRPGPSGEREPGGPGRRAPAAAAAASAPAAAASAAPSPCPSASGSPAATAASRRGHSSHQPRGPSRPGRLECGGRGRQRVQLRPERGSGRGSMNCTVTVPAHPLTAQGLATPWELGDGCTWANGGTEGVFIDATILSPNGQLQVYNPLVITQGTTPAVAPTPPTIARGSRGHPQRRVQRQRAGPGGHGRARQGNCLDRPRQLADQPDRRSATRPTSTGWPTSRSPAAS